MSLGILRVIGIIVFLYLLWRNLKDDYNSQKIITFSWLSILGFLVIGRLVYGVVNWGVWNTNLVDWVSVWSKPGMSYLGAYLGMFLVGLAYAKKQEWKFFTLMEDSLMAFLVLGWFLMADELVRTNFNLTNLIYLVILVLALVIFIFFKKKYRSFVWYKSGKKGFAFLMTNLLIFLALAGVFLMFKEKLVDVILALVLSLLSGVGLFILGDIKKKL